MPTTHRTDVHRPVEMDPADYEYLWAFDNQQPGVLVNVDMDWWRSITHWDPATRERGTHQCHHCGANIRYVAILRHLPTGFSIAVGETCLDNRFELESKADFDRLRKAAQLDRQKMRIKTAAAEFLTTIEDVDTNLALSRETDLTETFGITPDSYAFRTITDIRDKLWNRYGSIFPNALALVTKLLKEQPLKVERANLIAAERAAENQIEAPEGRLFVEGVVIKRVEQEGDYGWYAKLTIKVKDANGNVWLCRITEPSNAPEIKRGDVVQFKATLIRSKDAAWFFFANGKRPSNFTVVRHEELGEADSLSDPDEV